MITRLSRQALLIGLLGAGLLAVAPAHADTYRADPALVAVAKREGQVVWYTTLIINQLVRPMVDAFNVHFPDIKVTYIKGDSQQNLLKLVNELRAGRVQADVWNLTSGMKALVDAGAAARLDLPSMKDLPPVFLDPNKYWVTTNFSIHTLAYNTNLVAKADVPRSHQDLLDPRWKGKFVWKAVDMSGSTGFVGNVLTFMGEEKGMEYLRALSKQNIAATAGSARGVLDSVIAAEYPIALQATNYHAVISASQGAPVDWIAVQPVTETLQLAGIAENAPHPHAAQLFLDFIISPAGQQVFQQAGYLPMRPEISASKPELKPEQGGFKATVFRPEYIDANFKRWTEVYNDLFR